MTFEREEGCGGKRNTEVRETLMGCLLYTLDWRLNSQLRDVPGPGSGPTTVWCMSQCSNQLSHLAGGKAVLALDKIPSSIYSVIRDTNIEEFINSSLH